MFAAEQSFKIYTNSVYAVFDSEMSVANKVIFNRSQIS